MEQSKLLTEDLKEDDYEDIVGNLPDDFYNGPSNPNIVYDDEYRRNRMLKAEKG
jgi:hypothetical protein